MELVELEFETLREHSYRGQPSELADQHYKDSLVAGSDSPFAIAARFMIETIFSHQYSHFPGSELGMKELIDQVNSGGVGTVRRLELELMQAGKVRERATFYFQKKHSTLHGLTSSCKTFRLIYLPMCSLTSLSKLFDRIQISYMRKGLFPTPGHYITDAAFNS